MFKTILIDNLIRTSYWRSMEDDYYESLKCERVHANRQTHDESDPVGITPRITPHGSAKKCSYAVISLYFANMNVLAEHSHE